MGPRLAAASLAALLVVAGCATPLPGPATDAPTDARTPDTTRSPRTDAGSPTSRGPPGTDAGTPTPSPAPGRTPSPDANASRLVLHDGYDPSYDPARTLRRVEELRGLRSVGTVHVHVFEFSTRGPEDVPDRTGTIGPAGARALQLYSSATVERPVSPGYALDEADGVHVKLLAAGATRRHYDGLAQELVLAHEYVHALQYQHGLYDGSIYRDRNTTDGRMAARMVLEGDAAFTAWRYHERYRPGAGSHLPLVNRTGDRARWPTAVGWGAYYEGFRYVNRTRPTPDERAALLADPPATTTRLLHPDRAGSRPSVPAPAVPQGFSVERHDRVGELVVRRVLRMNGFAYPRAAAAAAGWRNGRMYYYETGEATPVHWVTRWHNGSEAAAFVRAWEALLAARNATAADGTLAVPGTDTTPAMHYVVRRDGATVHVTAGRERRPTERLARAWRERES